MIIDADTERLLIVSDLHVGNPFSEASESVVRFLEHARNCGADLCINGDGLEILQTSFANLASDSVEILRQISYLLEAGQRVFYVVGNHDIVLEQFLETWSHIHICPFLNVRSGGKRIRVEHGHLYDPFFVRSPDLYEALTKAAGPLLHIYPDIYHLWSHYQRLKDRMGKRRDASERPPSVYYEAAEMLLRRGFDCVVFGHTHEEEVVEFEPGRKYINSGNWMHGGTYVDISNGEATLEHWH